MRLAYITETYPPELNGVALTVARTVAYLRDRGHGLLLVRPRQTSEAARDDGDEWRTASWPIPVYRQLRFGLAAAGSVAQRLRRHRAELVHIATQGPLGWAALHAAQQLGLPVTADFRTRFDQVQPALHRRVRQSLDRCLDAPIPQRRQLQLRSDRALARPAQPEELSPAYVFLASPVTAAYITGIVLPVTGSVGAI